MNTIFDEYIITIIFVDESSEKKKRYWDPDVLTLGAQILQSMFV